MIRHADYLVDSTLSDEQYIQMCAVLCPHTEAVTEAVTLETWERVYVPAELRSSVADPYDGLGEYAGAMVVVFLALFVGALAVISEGDK